MQRRSFLAGSALAAASLAAPACALQGATPVAFDAAWQPVTFRRIPPTRFLPEGRRLGVVAEASASLIWRPVPEEARGARRAGWRWSVAASVPPTDIGRKGGDDRNLALYFVFSDAATAARAGTGGSLRRLLGNPRVRALIQVWGGEGAPGTIVASPYLPGRGVSVIRRPAGTGDHAEEADLAADHIRAFGTAPEVLIGLAVSSDADDTATRVEAVLADLTLG